MGHPAPAEQHLRTSPVHFLGLAQQRVVPVDDLGVDLLRHRDERDLAMQLHQRQTGRPRGLDDRRRQPAEARSELDHQGRDAPVGETADKGALFRGPGAETEARGEQQLAALEQGCDVRHLARVHPAHRTVQPFRAGDDLRESGAQPGQFERPLDRDATLGLH